MSKLNLRGTFRNTDIGNGFASNAEQLASRLANQREWGASGEKRTHKDIAYRPDIDGLRAIAVLLVVGYHAFPGLVPGGFIGVDVFFVVSGFLISSIIFKNLEAGTFSFQKFYSRRIKRIFPALALVLITALLVGWFELAPGEYKQLGWHVAAGAGFAANLALWNESGYFGGAAVEKPLLHLWSLGIEEQFYLVWPLWLWLSFRLRLNRSALVVCIIAISFVLNIHTIDKDAVADFYSPLPRFWELMLGALLAYSRFGRAASAFPHRRAGPAQSRIFRHLWSAPAQKIVRETTAISGIVLIGLAAAISNERSFPGWWALMPTTGALLIVAAGRNCWLNDRLLSIRWLVWIGLISYPLYLWHWPLLTFARIFNGEPPNPGVRIAVILVSFGLAWLTYRWVEVPVRFGAQGRKISLYLCALMVSIGCLGYYCFANDGFPFRAGDKADFEKYFLDTPPVYQYAIDHKLFEAYSAQCDFYDNRNSSGRQHIDPTCYTPATKDMLLVWGDSHAQHLFYGLERSLPKRISILKIATSSCAPSLTDRPEDPLGTCNRSNRFALATIAAKKPEIVLLAQGSGHLTTDFDEIADALKKLGVRRVLLVGPVPQWEPALYKVIMNDFWDSTPRRSFRGVRKDVLDSDKALRQKYLGSDKLTYISIVDFFCDGDGCLLYLGNNRRDGIVTFDYGHLTPRASEYLGTHLLAPTIVKSLSD